MWKRPQVLIPPIAVWLFSLMSCSTGTTTTEKTGSAIIEESSCAQDNGAAPKEYIPSYYSARQALARLVAYRHSSPMRLWQVVPCIAVGEASKESYNVGGWIFWYQDADGTKKRGSLSSHGDIKLTPAEFEPKAPAPISVKEWILDDIDAHRLVLSQGGRADVGFNGASLVAANVQGKGVRPVWARWFVGQNPAGVDAQTGEIYLQRSDSSFQVSKASGIAAWDGDFNEASDAAKAAIKPDPCTRGAAS